MKTASRVLLLVISCAVLVKADETVFYSQSTGWPSGSTVPANWTAAAGTPSFAFGWAMNDDSAQYTQTRLLYTGTLPTQDYSITNNYSRYTYNINVAQTSYQYLRASGNSWYEVR